MPAATFTTRLRGYYRRKLVTNFVRRPVQVDLPGAIVTFTFDDFPASALDAGGAILEKYGLAGTYYVSLGLAGKMAPVGPCFVEADLPRLLARGHELGCHTFDHCHAWDTPPAEYERSMQRNRARLDELIPGTPLVSHSYPINYPRLGTKAHCARRFACARGGGQKANEGVTDANNLASFFLEKSRDNFPAIAAQIDRAKAARAWLIFATHDVCAQPTPFGCTPELFEQVVRHTLEAGVTVLPVSRAFARLTAPGAS